MVINNSFWKGRRVLITGHTGFKGGWLSLWLNELGALVYGFSDNDPDYPWLFKEANVLSSVEKSIIGDIRNAELFSKVMADLSPEIVIHMAAQPLVKESYLDPIHTYSTNVMGTVNLFESVRKVSSVKAVLNITSDKCYENNESDLSFKEIDPMGGHDPYSSSKGCSELISAAYRKSFLEQKGIAVATARAGNVIGGGDWAIDRLVPDCMRAWSKKHVVNIRSPSATRPWQHVLEPLSGYLTLACHLPFIVCPFLFFNGASGLVFLSIV